jgi:hypothetical protein
MERQPGPGDGTGECPDRGPGLQSGAPPARDPRLGEFAGDGVTVTCAGQPGDETWKQELVRDMPAIVTSFAGRRYGQRSAMTRRLRTAVAGEAGGDAA